MEEMREMREAAERSRQLQMTLWDKFQAGQKVTFPTPNGKGFAVQKSDLPPAISVEKKKKKIKFPSVEELKDSVQNGEEDVVAYLLDKGGDVNEKDANGMTPLHYAGLENELSIARLLLDRGANVNARDHAWWTPLHAAASAGAHRICNMLIAAGADVTAVSADGDLPVDVAEDARTEGVLERGLDTQGLKKDDLPRLRSEEEKKTHQAIKDLISSGNDVNMVVSENGASALHVCVSNGYKDSTALLLRHPDIDINKRDNDLNTPLHVAVMFEEYPCVMQLVMSGANIHARNALNQEPAVLTEDETLLKILQSVNEKEEYIQPSAGFSTLHRTAMAHRNRAEMEDLKHRASLDESPYA